MGLATLRVPWKVSRPDRTRAWLGPRAAGPARRSTAPAALVARPVRHVVRRGTPSRRKRRFGRTLSTPPERLAASADHRSRSPSRLQPLVEVSDRLQAAGPATPVRTASPIAFPGWYRTALPMVLITIEALSRPLCPDRPDRTAAHLVDVLSLEDQAPWRPPTSAQQPLQVVRGRLSDKQIIGWWGSAPNGGKPRNRCSHRMLSKRSAADLARISAGSNGVGGAPDGRPQKWISKSYCAGPACSSGYDDT